MRVLICGEVPDRVAGFCALLALCAAGLPTLSQLATAVYFTALRSALSASGWRPSLSCRHRSVYRVSGATSWLAHLAAVVIAAVLAVLLRAPVGVAEAGAILRVVLLASTLPISRAGWGVREVVVGLGLIGTPTATAGATSALCGRADLVAGLTGGLACLAIPAQPRAGAGRTVGSNHGRP